MDRGICGFQYLGVTESDTDDVSEQKMPDTHIHVTLGVH